MNENISYESSIYYWIKDDLIKELEPNSKLNLYYQKIVENFGVIHKIQYGDHEFPLN